MKSRILAIVLLAVLPVALLAQGRGQAPRPRRAVIVTGENSFNGHVWKETSVELKNILDAGKDFAEVNIEASPGFIADPAFLTYDVAVFDFRNQNPFPNEEAIEANLLKFLSQAKGLLTIHWANGAFPYWAEFQNMVGRAQQSRHDNRGQFTVRIANPDHPITRGMSDYQADDELFWDSKVGNRLVNPLAVAKSNMQFAEYPMVMTIRYGNSNVVNIPMGHDVRALKVPGTAELIRKSAAWTVGLIK